MARDSEANDSLIPEANNNPVPEANDILNPEIFVGCRYMLINL